MRILWIVLGAAGLWFIASAATQEGLLPSGHGTGRLSEALTGVALVAYAAFRFWRTSRK